MIQNLQDTKNILIQCFNKNDLQNKEIELIKEYNELKKTINDKNINNNKINELTKSFEKEIEKIKQYVLISDYIINIFDIYNMNFDFDFKNINDLKSCFSLIEKENELRNQLTTFGSDLSFVIDKIVQFYEPEKDETQENKKEETTNKLKDILEPLKISKIEPDTFVEILTKVSKKIHENEHLNLFMESFFKYNSINFITKLNKDYINSSINSFDTLSENQKNDLIESIKKIKNYTNKEREKELVEPGLKYNNEISLGLSEESKAWIALFIKITKDHSNESFKSFFDDIRKENKDLIGEKVIKELEELSSKNLIKNITNLEIYNYPNSLQVIFEKLLTYNIGNLTNIVDLIGKLKPEQIQSVISNLIDNGLEVTSTLIDSGLKSLDFASFGKTFVIKKTISSIWNSIPDSIKENNETYKKIKKTKEDIINHLKDSIVKQINQTEIINYLESKIGMLATSKDTLLENLGNSEIKSSFKVFENVGNKIINDNLIDYESFQKNNLEMIKDINKNVEDIFGLGSKTHKDLKYFQSQFLGTIEEIEAEIKNIENFDLDIFDLNIESIYFFKKHLNEIKLDPILNKDLIEIKNFLLSIEKGVTPNLEKLKSFINNDIDKLKPIISLNYKEPKEGILQKHLYDLKKYYLDIIQIHENKFEKINSSFEREVFLEDLLNQIDKASTPHNKKTYYLNSFIAMNHNLINTSEIDYNNDFDSKSLLLKLSKNDLEKRLEIINKNESSLHLKNFKTNIEVGIKAIEMLEDYIKLDRYIKTGDIFLIKDIEKFFNDSLNINNLDNNELENDFIKHIKLEVIGKRNELKKMYLEKEISKEFHSDESIISKQLINTHHSKWLDIISENVTTLNTNNIIKQTSNLNKISKNLLNSLLSDKKTIMDSFIENNNDYNFNIKDYKNKSFNVVNNDRTISKFIISNVASTTLNYYIKGLKKDVSLDEIDIGMKKLILLSDSNKFLNKTKNELLFDIIKEELSYENKDLTYKDEQALDIIMNKNYILKNNNETKNEYYNDYYNTLYKEKNNITKLDEPIFNLSEFSIEELNIINSSRYVKYYFSNLFEKSMDNSLDEYLIKSMKNNELNLNDISNEDLIYMRQESSFVTLEKSWFEYVNNGGLLLSNNNYVALYNKTVDDVENNYLKIKQFFIDKIKINFDNTKDILF